MTSMNSSLDLEPIAADALRDVFASRFERQLVSVSLDDIPEVPGDAPWLISTVHLEGSQAPGIVHLQVSESLMDLLNK